MQGQSDRAEIVAGCAAKELKNPKKAFLGFFCGAGREINRPCLTVPGE